MIGHIWKLDIRDQELGAALPEASAWQSLALARGENGQTSGKIGKKRGAQVNLS